MESVEITRTV